MNHARKLLHSREELRTLAGIAEEAIEALEMALESPEPGIRYEAVEGLWQVSAIASLPKLREALEREADVDVRAALERVIGILQGLA